MRRQFLYIVLPGVILGIFIWLAVSGLSGKGSASNIETLLQPVNATAGQLSFADRNLKAAQTFIKKAPGDPRGFNSLAAAFMQKGRETGDFSFNARAEESLRHSFRVAPENFEGIKLRAELLVINHRFSEALEQSQRALEKNPRDHAVYDAMVDALVELGDYDRAVDAAQKRVDLRPDTPAYSRISYLRTLHGDDEGAAKMMKMAAGSATPGNPEGIAWCRVHLGEVLMNLGKPDEAEREFDHALFIFPDYHLALAAKARARFRAGDIENAVALYKRAAERVPSPEYIAALGDLYTKLGRADEAMQQYGQVEFIEKAGVDGGTYSRQLAMFWADHDLRLDDALAIAQREREARRDIYASDTLAWCLYKKGRFLDAQIAVNEALRLGTRDPKLFYHAGMIALSLGERQAGEDFLEKALAINPSFDILHADVAREELKKL